MKIKAFYIFLVLVLATIAGPYLVINGFGSYALIATLILPIALAMFKNMFIGLLILIMMIPLESTFLSVNSSGAFTYTRILGILIMGIWVLKVIVERKKLKNPSSLKWLIPLFIWAALSVFWAQYTEPVLTRLVTMIQLAGMFYLVVNEINTPERLKLILLFFFASCVLSAILALVGINTTLRGGLLTMENQGPKEFATYLGIVLLLAIVYLSIGTNKMRWLAWVAVLISIPPFLASGERGVAVALIASLAAVIFLGRYKVKLFVFSFLSFSILAIALQILVSSGWLNQYILIRFTPQNIIETGGSSRTDIWKVGLNMVRDNPWGGVGLDNFAYEFYRYIPITSITRNLNDFTDPHSDPIRIAGELGLVGFFLYIGLLGTSAWQIYMASRKEYNAELYFLVIIVLALLIFFLTNGLISSFIWRKSYWLVLGLTAVVPLIVNEYSIVSMPYAEPEK